MAKFENYWSKELTEEQKQKLNSMHLDDEDITTDFDWLHYDNYVENYDTDKKTHQLAFYNNDCLWQLTYFFGGAYFRLECVFEPSEEKFKKSFEDIKDLLLGDSNQIVHIWTKENNHILKVAYYTEEHK